MTLRLPVLQRGSCRHDARRKARRMFGICNNPLALVTLTISSRRTMAAMNAFAVFEVLRDCRNDFTVFSGVSHPDVMAGIRR